MFREIVQFFILLSISKAFAVSIPDLEVSPNPAYIAKRSLRTGLGTRYGDDCTEEDCWQNGACSFVNYKLPSTVEGSTCVSEKIWNNGAQCGGCISVTYKGKTITVMVCLLIHGCAL